MTDPHRGTLWAVIAGLGFVGLELTLRAAAPGVPADAASVVRLIPILLVAWLGTWLTGSGRSAKRLLVYGPKRGWLWLALATDGLLNLYAGVTLKIMALQHGSVLVVLTAIEAGNLFGTAFIVRRLGGRPLSRRGFIGICLVVVGTAAASAPLTGPWGDHAALGLALASGLSFALAVGAMSWALRQGVPLWPALAVSSTVGLMATWVGAIAARQQGFVIPLLASEFHRPWLLLSGLFYALALAALSRALQRTQAVAADAISGSNGPVAAALGGWIFGPAPAVGDYVGVTLVLIGAWIVRAPTVPEAAHGSHESPALEGL